MGRHRLSPLFEPSSIALVGASDREGSLGRLLRERLAAGGYAGRIGLVNPGHRKVAGSPCVRSLRALDFVPELAIIAAPLSAAPSILLDCASIGTPIALLACAGPPGIPGPADRTRGPQPDRPSGANTHAHHHGPAPRDGTTPDAPAYVSARSAAAGEAGTPDLGAVARAHGVRLVGPDCLTLLRPSLGLHSSLDVGPVATGRVALLSQSNTVAQALLDWARASGIGFSSVLSLGEEQDLDVGELLDFFLYDRQTDAVLLYLDAVHDARRFMSSVRALSRAKPVIVMKAEDIGEANEADPRPPGRDPFLADLLAGTERAFEAAIARAGAVRARTTMQFLSSARLLAQRRRPAGRRLGIVSSGHGPATIAAAAARLNTLEVTRQADVGWTEAGRLQAALDAVAADPQVDAALALYVPQPRCTPGEAASAIIAAARATAKPLVAVLAGGHSVAAAQRQLDAAGVPQFLAPENAVDALALLDAFQRNQRKLREVPQAFDEGFAPDVAAAQALYRSVLADGRTRLDDAEARQLLGLFGLTVRPAALATDPTRRDLFAGLADAPGFGTVIVFGAGGAAAEQIDDVALALPPLNGPLAQAMVRRTRVARRLQAYRDVPAIDHAALERWLLRLSTLACACPWIGSLDVNPLCADATGVAAASVRVEVRPPGAASRWRGAYGHLAIHPYPRELEERLVLRDGTAVLLRPIRPEDAELERAFIASLSRQTLYRRFMMPVKELPDTLIERFTQIDYDRELALVALTDAHTSPRIAAVGRILPTWEDGVAEFAIVVGDWIQQTGLGRELMLRLFDACRARGYRVVEGVVLGSNLSMLRFCERLGFTIRQSTEDPGERIARLRLS